MTQHKLIKKSMKKNSIIFFLCYIFVAGCVTVTPESTSPTANLNTATITVSPTKSLIPTRTLTPSPTLNLTQQVAATMLEATLVVQTAQSNEIKERLNAIKSEFSEICESYIPSLSPNENWLAQDCRKESRFLVSSRNSSQTIVIPYKEIAKLTGDTMISSMQPLFWTKDGRFLFFTQQTCCLDTDAFGWDGPLFRLNLKTGEWQKLISSYSNYFSFSPDGNRLIHIPDNHSGAGMPVVINVIDIETWAQQTILLNDYEQAGSLVWAPDESGFAITSKIGNYYSGGEVFTVMVVDLSSETSKIIFSQDTRFIGPVGWSSDNIITLMESCNQLQSYDCANQFLYYDLNSESFSLSP